MAMGLPFHRLDEAEALAECERLLDQSEPKHIVTANADFVAKAWHSPELKRIIVNAHRVFCDGQPIVWMSKLLRRALPARVAGSDLTPKLLKRAAERGDKVFLFGTDPETLTALQDVLPTLYPGLQLVGSESPPYGEIDSWDNESYVRTIRESGANLLLVCLGFPKQDVWIDRYLKRIGTVSLAIGIGASLDFIAGKQKRAPRFVQAVGMEWFWRLAQEPSRMIGRYTNDLVCLIQSGGMQLRRVWSPRRERGRNVRFLNGVSWDNTISIEPHEARDIADLCKGKLIRSVVMNCQNVDRASVDTMDSLVVMLRTCRRLDMSCALFNAPVCLLSHIREMKLGESLPSFRHPGSVAAWAEAVSLGGFGSGVDLSIPNQIHHRSNADDLLTDVRELLKHAPGATSHFRLNLANISSLNVSPSMWLVALKGMISSGELGAKAAMVSLINPMPELRDSFGMLGLGAELEQPAIDKRALHSREREEETATRGFRSMEPDDVFRQPAEDEIVLSS